MVGVALANPDLAELYGANARKRASPKRARIDGQALVTHDLQMQSVT